MCETIDRRIQLIVGFVAVRSQHIHKMTQNKTVINVNTAKGEFHLIGRPCELSAYSFIPTERHDPPEKTVFNSTGWERHSGSTYNRLFHHDYGYDEKLHRCDREHSKSRGLAVNEEEKLKTVPSLSSSTCGHRLRNADIDPRETQHVRIAHVQTEFYRRNDINIDTRQTIPHS